MCLSLRMTESHLSKCTLFSLSCCALPKSDNRSMEYQRVGLIELSKRIYS